MGGLAWPRSRKGVAELAAANEAVYAFSPRLIEELRGEHRALLKRCAELEKMVIGSQFANIPHALAGFKAKFNLHALRESLHCYGYVERSSAGRPAELASVTKLRREIHVINGKVQAFFEKYRVAGVNRANAPEFLTGLRATGKILLQRIEREEAELYTLYRA